MKLFLADKVLLLGPQVYVCVYVYVCEGMDMSVHTGKQYTHYKC